MNTDKLKELIDKIRTEESRINTQQHLKSLGSVMHKLVNEPQSPEHQNALATNQNRFRVAMERFEAAFPPRDYERVLELSEVAFSRELPDEISQAVQENPMSPNVVNEKVQQLHSTRNEVLTKLNQLADSLQFFEFGYEDAEEGQVEIGFQIPRDLFDNKLDGLIDELKQIKGMIGFISEATIGKYEPATVGSISTTDPLIFLGVSVEVAKQFGLAVTWGIGVWYSVEQIRKVRADTTQIEAFTVKEIEGFYDKKIKEQIDQAVAEEVEEILDAGNATKTRRGELSGSLKWVLEALLAKIERGLTIELRLPPPPKEVDEKEDEVSEEGAAAIKAHQELLEVEKQLVFPEPSENPVLTIPEMKDVD